MSTESKGNDLLRIAFVPRRSRIRPYKIAKSLKYSGKVYLILVCEESFYDKDLFEGIFDEVHFFTRKNFLFNFPKSEKIYRWINERIGFGLNRMIRILKNSKPDIVHCFAEPYNHIEYVLKHTNFKVVMSDGADFTGISEGIENLSTRVKRQEKFCFENVDGILHKGPRFEIEYYENHGYNISAKEITWFDHCDDDLIQKESHNFLRDKKELHIVYTGNISSDINKPYVNYIEFARSMDRQKVHFHIYSNPYQYYNSTEYSTLSRELEYFHFHKPLPYKQLVKEISIYDWGLWWHDPSKSDRLNKNKSKVAIGNKMFTYLEAGLPIIVGKHNGHGRIIIEKNNIGISMDRNDIYNLEKILIDIDDKIYQRVSNTRNTFRLSKNFTSIMNFYSSLL